MVVKFKKKGFKSKKRKFRSKPKTIMNAKKSQITRVLFPSNHRTLPDRLWVTLYSTLKFYSATGVGTNGADPGAAAYFNVNASYLDNPFLSSGLGPAFQAYTALTTAQGMQGTLAVGFGTQVTPAFYAQLMDMYRFYYVNASTISVEVDLDSANDEGDLCIRPLNNIDGNTTSFKNAIESRFAKKGTVGFYSTGTTRQSNRLTNSITTPVILGYPVTPDKMTLDDGFVGVFGAGPTKPYHWQVLYQNKHERVTSGEMSFLVKMSYNVCLFQPKPHQT